ncbi:GH39 family glycosyl hydrolase [Flexithrix dorotheae]|uniref:GH39 family glycosyl hydrolase n=1 Tax=Flexithrix dorotheae TaxID=70993 RepID=UPI00039DDE9C|nr:hypothetical protein [Flexithrix dorotheae]
MRNKLYILLFCIAHLACTEEVPALKDIGKVKVKKAKDIEGSDLWIGGEVLDRDLCSYDAYKEYLGTLAAKKIRLQSGWAKTEKERGVYDFAWLDHIVDDAISRGVQPWIQISYGNPIYPGSGGVSLSQGLITSDEALDAYANYSTTLVNHFKDRVNEWEVWNEADHRFNRAMGHGELLYAKMFEKSADAIRAAQPDAKIIALSIAGVGRVEFVGGFFDYLKERGKVDLVDVVSFHGYPRNPDGNFNAVKRLVNTTQKYSDKIEFWQGETGCPSSLGSTGALSKYPWTEASQAKWNSRRALAHLGRGIPFSLFLLSEFVYNDTTRKGLNTKGILKINEEDFSVVRPKPAYFAYQHLTSVFNHELTLSNENNLEVASDSSVSIFNWKNAESLPVIAYWTDASIPADNDTFHEIKITVNPEIKQPVLVNVISGKVQQIGPGLIEKNGDKVIYKLPCYDAPMLLTDLKAIEIDNMAGE